MIESLYDDQITPGMTVKFADFPDIKWVVHKGKYIYHSRSKDGWYLRSVNNHKLLPIDTEDFGKLIVLSGEVNHSRYPKQTYEKDEMRELSPDLCDVLNTALQLELDGLVTKSELNAILGDIPNWDYF